MKKQSKIQKATLSKRLTKEEMLTVRGGDEGETLPPERK